MLFLAMMALCDDSDSSDSGDSNDSGDNRESSDSASTVDMTDLPLKVSECSGTPATTTKCSFEWSIDCFSLRSLNVGAKLESPIFPDDDGESKWRLCAYLGGRNQDSEDYIALYLRSCNETDVSVRGTISILDAHRVEKFKKPIGAKIFRNGEAMGIRKFVLSKNLRARGAALLVDDRLTIYCEVSSAVRNKPDIGPPPTKKRKIDPEEAKTQISEDFGTLVGRSEFCDFTLVVRGKEFHAYKGILAARSEVFAAMLRHNMDEQKQNRIIIDDIDPEVFSEVLYYIYTDKAPKVDEMAPELLEVAEKYALQELKAMCEEALAAGLSVETAAETLALADLYRAKMLQAQTVAFIKDNSSSVSKTENWQNVKENYPHLVEECGMWDNSCE